MASITPQERSLYDILDNIGITHKTIYHPEVSTVEEAMREMKNIPNGVPCKNLLLQNKKGGIYIVCLRVDTIANINKMAKDLGLSSLQFAKEDILGYLGITKGGVTPFALLNDSQKRISVIIDNFAPDEQLIFHPMRKDASCVISYADLHRFIAHFGAIQLLFQAQVPQKN